jgi:hypothetical protein
MQQPWTPCRPPTAVMMWSAKFLRRAPQRSRALRRLRKGASQHWDGKKDGFPQRQGSRPD